MTSWGLANAHFLSPGHFSHRARLRRCRVENMELLAEAVTPFHGQVMVKPLAWTPSTKGVVTAQVVLLDPPGFGSAARRWIELFRSAPPPPEPKWAAPPMPEKAKPRSRSSDRG